MKKAAFRYSSNDSSELGSEYTLHQGASLIERSKIDLVDQIAAENQQELDLKKTRTRRY